MEAVILVVTIASGVAGEAKILTDMTCFSFSILNDEQNEQLGRAIPGSESWFCWTG